MNQHHVHRAYWRILVSSIAIYFAAAACNSSHAQSFYSLIDLGDLAGGADGSRGMSISGNSQYIAGDSVGTLGPHTTGFGVLWTVPSMGMTPVGHIPGSGGNTGALGVNSSGQVVGVGLDSANRGQAFRWQGGVMTLLPKLTDYEYSNDASSVNDVGQVAGTSSSFFSPRAVRWDAAGNVENLSGNFAGRGIGINDAGHVAGYMNSGSGDRGMLWGDLATDLGDLPGGADFSQAYAVNDLDWVVGMSAGSAGEHAFLWTQLDGMIDLGSIPGGFDGRSEAFGINNLGQVVGSSNEGPSNGRAFLWHNSHGMVDLNLLVDSSATGWHLGAAKAINDAGWIVGSGFTPWGSEHGFLLIPIAIPEPNGFVLLTLIGSSLSMTRRRRIRGQPLHRATTPMVGHAFESNQH